MIADAVYPTQGASAAMAAAAGQDCGLAMAMAGVNDHPQDNAAMCTAHHTPGALTQVGGSSAGSGAMGGVLAYCLAFLVTVLTAIAGLYPCWLRIFVRLRAPGLGLRVWAIAVRAPGLAQLCVMRT